MNPTLGPFWPRAVLWGDVLLLAPGDALRLVRRCRDAGVEVLGIDGFIVTADSTQPLLDQILDCTGESFEAGWQAAEQFLRERLDTPMMFEVVC